MSTISSRTARSFADICLVVLFGMVILLGLIFVLKIPDGIINEDRLTRDYHLGWQYEDGSPADVENPIRDQGVTSISRIVNSDEISGLDLCVETSNLEFDVYIGDRLIYSFHPDLPEFYGKFYGNYVHFINIPDFVGEEKITIVYDPLIDIDWTAFRSMELSLSSTYFRGIMQRDIVQFLTCFVILLSGMLIVLLGFIFDKEKERLAETVSLGTVAVVLACYSNTGSLVIQAITQNSAVPRVIEIVSLILLPIPTIIFIASLTDCLEKWWVKVMIGLPIVNLIANFVIVRNTSLDFHDILISSHIIIIIGLGVSIFMTVRHLKNTFGAKKKKIKNINVRLIISVATVFICGVIDIVKYYTTSTRDPASFTRFGLLIFIILMGYGEMRALLDISKQSIEAEVMRKVAYTDALTGMANREAFYEYEKEIKALKHGKRYVVQLDLNNLKLANDNYGHASGDILIRGAADCIMGAFDVEGKSFRTGGDEFIAIVESDYEQTIDRMNELIDKFNETSPLEVPLQIAYGMAEYNAGKDDLDQVEQLADDRMYKLKKEMKAKAAAK